MKSTVRTLGSRAPVFLALVASAGLATSAFAEITADEISLVWDKRTNKITEHEDAVFIRYVSSQPPDKKVGIFFMQTKGAYAFKPFHCTDSAWHPPSQSNSCSIESVKNGIQLRETVTIGRLPGNFCKGLRQDKNPDPNPNPNNPVMHQSECPVGAGHCVCYEVRHECRATAADPYEEGNCPDPWPTAAGATQSTDTRAGAPPSRGAGSGGSK